MHRAFWMAGRTGSEQPDRDVVTVRVCRPASRGLRRKGLRKRKRLQAVLRVDEFNVDGVLVTDHQHRSQMFRARYSLVEWFKKRFVHDRRAGPRGDRDRKSTRLNSSHLRISY